ncbi:fumarylacetoacetate hydrolase family protein [Nocardia panacis]|uniref:Fumarylacetoacetate hydrolase family protein n=1 Tax=Nocardia panacis TaxID=2340916 RepID=A0A3A4KFB3_9NOCA|nr:fumarylacetoacetate hydrolase family protein [Nocardia panacis]
MHLRPGKIVAVHLNYRSRAVQRGRAPDHPSYFLKPSSSLSADGAALVRPPGCELLAFEGEIALVIGERTRDIEPEQGWSRVQWVTAANDAGLHDLRYADRGSNLRSKGGDGFTPVGPVLLDATELDPRALRLRTWVNGELVQDDSTENLLFDLGLLVADLSRTSTLEPGDIILTGTPAGASVVVPGDVVEVQVDDGVRSTGRLRNPVVAGEYPLAAFGAPPKVDATARADAYGRTPGLDPELAAQLNSVGTATLSAQLRNRGLPNMSIDGVRPTKPGLRLLGIAKTLRYLPLREDLVPVGPMNAQKRSVESVAPGEVLVMEARGEHGAGTIGDILALRAQMRGAAGIVTDGAVRDSAAVAALDIPTYAAAAHPSVLGRLHIPWETDTVIACGGTVVRPGDILVGDDDGVIVVPPALAGEVAEASVEQERQERFIAEQVASGASIVGLYPLGPDWRERYRIWCAADESTTN